MEEKKISKFKENYNKIKKLYDNRRYRALVILGFYAIFFIIVIAMINMSKTEVINKDYEELTTLEKFGKINNYEYTYKIEQTIDGEIIHHNIDGKRNINKEIFTIENNMNTYYIDNNEIYVVRDNNKEKVDNPLNINIWAFQPNNISDFLKSSVLQSTTTDYQNNTIENTYALPLRYFVKFYFNYEMEDEERFVSIIVTEKNDNIIKIEMDFTNIDMSNDYNIFDYNKLEFNYKNIGNVEKIIDINTEQ